MQDRTCPQPVWHLHYLGHMAYAAAERLQHEYAQQLQPQQAHLLCLEHEAVFTLGRSASEADVLWSAEQCARRGVALVATDRGGQTTYHGPGQLVGYLILQLRDYQLSVPEFVWQVEAVLIKFLETFNLSGERCEGRPGLWCAGKKIASLGFHIGRGVTRHGFAINVQPDLSYFSGIIPCGQPTPVTSMQEQLGRTWDLSALSQEVAACFARYFLKL